MISPSLPERTDVLVAGSGAAGLVSAMTAALSGAHVVLVEAGELLGGTTALSGGRVWIPANGTPANHGDTVEAAVTYLDQVFDRRYEPMIRTFASTAYDMMRFVETNTPHRFVSCPHYPDYRQDLAGSTAGGRCFDVAPIAVDTLVPEASGTLLPNAYLPMTHSEWEQWRVPDRYNHELLRRRQADSIRTGGPGLASALIDGAVRAGVQLVTDCALVDLELDENGAVRGARLRHRGENRTINASAVILATGGFDGDDALRHELLPEPLGASASTPTNTGAALRISRDQGFAIDNLGEGWWMPMTQLPGETVLGKTYPRALIRERGVPHQIVVNRAGERFCDEALPYNDFGKAIHHRAPDGTYPNQESWLVFDEQFRRTYTLPGLTRTGELPGHILHAPTLRELGILIGVDAPNLERTAERWNAMCENGIDTDFGRGGNDYDLYYGDPTLTGNSTMGTVKEGPFYALGVFSATIGSKGGPVTTVDGQILRPDGSAVPGAYAIGNAAAFWTADGYPGPGATLSIGMTFGFRAGLDAANACSGVPRSSVRAAQG